MPSAHTDLLPGVTWGHPYAVFTPAFWATQGWMAQVEQSVSDFRIGRTLEEEIAACLLGGHGISAEIGLAAFYRLRDHGLITIDRPPTDNAIYQVLSAPLEVGNRQVHYRFASQRSKYLSAALKIVKRDHPPTQDDLAFRGWLLGIRGIGPKTASWITRNWLNSDRVAIIDIHIHRAGLLMGLYHLNDSPASDYFVMEDKFLAFARGIDVKPSLLDALIWRHMKNAGNTVLNLIKSIRH